jgi:hypothetical protein
MANTQTTVPLFVANQVLTAAQQNASAGTGVPVFATTVTRDAAFGGSNKALAEGQLCYIEASDVVQYYTGAAWATVGPSATTRAIFNETQAQGTNGGTYTTGSWATRVLNTTVYNNITSASLATNAVSLPAGTYYMSASAGMFYTTETQLRIYNNTDSANVALSQIGYMGATTDALTMQSATAIVTITGTKSFIVQHRGARTSATQGLGIGCSWDQSVFATFTIEKLA